MSRENFSRAERGEKRAERTCPSSSSSFDNFDPRRACDCRRINKSIHSPPPSPLPLCLPAGRFVSRPFVCIAIFFSTRRTNLISHETFMQSGKFVRGHRLLSMCASKEPSYLKLCIDVPPLRYARALARPTRAQTYVCTDRDICACVPRLSRLSLLFHIGISRESDVPRLYRRRSQVPYDVRPTRAASAIFYTTTYTRIFLPALTALYSASPLLFSISDVYVTAGRIKRSSAAGTAAFISCQYRAQCTR